ncbi:HAAS signaling domain-containing protein [Anaerosporobacter sp.]
MDDELMNEFLEAVKRNLKYLSEEEKADIIYEIKSHIQETKIKQGIDMKSILQNLGDPKKLGKAYVGKVIADTVVFNSKSFFRALLYYSSTGINGMILTVIAGSLYISSFITLIGGCIKTVGALLGYNMSFITFILGNFNVPDILALPIALPVSMLLYYVSKKMWKIFKSFLRKSSENYRLSKYGYN